MQSEEKATKEVILIIYYNVIFYLVFKAGIDDFKRQCLVDRIVAGEQVSMKIIYDWCVSQGILISMKFVYRKDFPIKANLWNLYSFFRFRCETILKLKIPLN